jgi:hypothetical protein
MISQFADVFADSMDRLADSFGAFIPETLHQCEPIVQDAVIENFSRQQSPDGKEWPERKFSKHDDGHPLLVETKREGSGSLFSAAAGLGGGHITRIEDNTLVWGVDKDGGKGGIPGAGVHNQPVDSVGHNKVPGREFLGIDDEHADRCGELFADAGVKEIAGAP